MNSSHSANVSTGKHDSTGCPENTNFKLNKICLLHCDIWIFYSENRFDKIHFVETFSMKSQLGRTFSGEKSIQ